MARCKSCPFQIAPSQRAPAQPLYMCDLLDQPTRTAVLGTVHPHEHAVDDIAIQMVSQDRRRLELRSGHLFLQLHACADAGPVLVHLWESGY